MNGGVGEMLSTSIVFTRTSISPVGSLGLTSFGAAGGDGAGDADDPFAAQLAGFIVGGLAAGVGVEDKLREAVAVAQVDEDQAAVVAVGMDPAGKFDFLADIGFAELAAGVGAITGFDCFHGGICDCRVAIAIEACARPASELVNRNCNCQLQLLLLLSLSTAAWRAIPAALPRRVCPSGCSRGPRAAVVGRSIPRS